MDSINLWIFQGNSLSSVHEILMQLCAHNKFYHSNFSFFRGFHKCNHKWRQNKSRSIGMLKNNMIDSLILNFDPLTLSVLSAVRFLLATFAD